MKNLLQPDLVLGKPVTDLSPEILSQHQIKGLILDVDETLVPKKSRQASDDLIAWLQEIRPIAKIWLVSNNFNKTRIERIANSLNLPYYLAAKKPSRKSLRQAATAMELPLNEIAMVGDRVFTDILAGNRLQLFTILVEPMVDPAFADHDYPIHRLEVQISQLLGVTFQDHHQTASPKTDQPLS
ncbi:MAG: YqeG family HAD IIIA-type phosphatase [Cyanobacteriota bacterium]